MNTVHPIKDINKIRQIETILKNQNQRDYMLFELGIYSGLRISDILKLKVSDLKNQDYFILKEQKTGKSKRLAINPSLKKYLAKYLLSKNDNEYIIESREHRQYLTEKIKYIDENGKTRSKLTKVKNIAPNSPITRELAWKILNKVANQIGIKEEVGCHTMRKTWAYHLYIKSGKDITLIQKLLNHSSSQVTLRYIGIVQEDMDDLVCSLSY